MLTHCGSKIIRGCPLCLHFTQYAITTSWNIIIRINNLATHLVGYFHHSRPTAVIIMGVLPDTWNRWLRMRRECRERFPRHRLQRKPLVSDPGMHQGTCVTHVPWFMSGSLTNGGGGNACVTKRKRMHNQQFYESGKRPISRLLSWHYTNWFLL